MTCLHSLMARGILFCCLCLTLSGCGYNTLGNMGANPLGDGSKTMKVRAINHPTLFVNLPYQLRSVLWDEVNKRRLAQWVDDGPSDYEISVNVLSFKMRSFASTREDTTLISNGEIQLAVIVYEANSSKIVWDSGTIAFNDQYSTAKEEDAIQAISQEALRRALDTVYRNF